MKATAKHRVVTSGRLTGGGRTQSARRQVNPGARPEPTYSLYSTDAEEQVATLHQGLDRCAALLGGILKIDATAPTVTCGAAKSRPPTSLEKKPLRKASKQTGSSRTPTPKSPAPPAHSGVKLHPTLRRTRRSRSAAPPPLPASVLLSAHQSSPRSPLGQAPERDSDGVDYVPMRDTVSPRTAADTCAVADTHVLLCRDGCAPVVCGIPEDTHSEAEPDIKEKTVQYLLGELKALIAGQGNVAERFLHHLEQALSPPLLSDGTSKVQQLKEKEKSESNSQVTLLQEEVSAAQSQLRELQHDLAELRGDLQEARGQLRGREAENIALRADLEATQSQLVDAEQEKSEWASLAQQRQEEIENLKRIHQSPESSVCSTVVQSLPATPRQPLDERVAQYLMSLGHSDPAAPQNGRPHHSGTPNSTLSQCDADSLWSDCSARSGSTFDTRDEAAFRDGLAALDASIASLQKTMQLDLRR